MLEVTPQNAASQDFPLGFLGNDVAEAEGVPPRVTIGPPAAIPEIWAATASQDLPAPAEEPAAAGYRVPSLVEGEWPLNDAAFGPGFASWMTGAAGPVLAQENVEGAVFPEEDAQLDVASWEADLPEPMPRTEVVFDPSAQSYLTDRVREVIDRMLPFLEHQARSNFVPVEMVMIRGYVDPEEGWNEIVVCQWVKLRGREALRYWDRLGAAFALWTKHLPARLTHTARERIRLAVDWTVPGRGV